MPRSFRICVARSLARRSAMKHSHYDTEGRSGQGYMGMRIVMRIVIRSVAGGWQVRARVSGTRPGRPHCTAVCGTLGSRGSALAFFDAAGAEPRVPRGLDLGGLIRGALAPRSERGTRVVPAIVSKSRRSSGRHRARMPTPLRLTDYPPLVRMQLKASALCGILRHCLDEALPPRRRRPFCLLAQSNDPLQNWIPTDARHTRR